MKIYKLVVLGSAGVGKSALTIQFVENIFVSNYDPTIEDCYQKRLDDYILEIYDTAGVDQFAVSKDSLIRSGDGFLIVYSITSQATFNYANDLREQIMRQKPNGTAIILVGNKCDLEEERRVSYDDGSSLARLFGCPFTETSAKNQINVENAFYHLTNQIIDKENEEAKRQASFYQSSRSVFSNTSNDPSNSNARRRKRDRFKKCNIL